MNVEMALTYARERNVCLSDESLVAALADEVERLRAIEARVIEMADFVLPPDHKDYARATAEADVAAMILERNPAYLAEFGKRLRAAREDA